MPSGISQLQHPSTALPRYEVLELLGQGGMGSVHRVRDRNDGRTLALKRLQTAQKRCVGAITEMFHSEFRTLTQLQHPNVVEVYDFGIDAVGPYYTMEWLDGADVQALAPMPWREVCALGRDVSSALALLHSRRLVHRDPSPRNIKRLASGTAKLIDFGGMMAVGIARNTVGTAPLVAPEVMLHQTLDARTDLYALGGTLYYALTGRHAYPVRTLAELHALWRVVPVAPSVYATDVPAELDRLVLSLLSLEPGARPRNAAEVIDRLSAIAELPRNEHASVSNAYLSTPELVGRQQELKELRRSIRELHAGHGGVVWIDGEPGAGRSRMLAAGLLEAKLSGAAVASARGDGSGAAYAVLRELVAGLASATAPSVRRDALLERLEAGAADPQFDRACRPQLQLELSALVRERAARVPLVLAIDDIERADEPSQAALARLTHESLGQRVLVLVTSAVARERASHPALALLAADAGRIELDPLRGEETRLLLASMFGDVPNLAALAVRIHGLAEGSPRGAVELAQYIVDGGRARYEMGAWILPAITDDASLPLSLTLARRRRLQALSPAARTLAQAIALADGSGLPARAYVELAEDPGPARAHAALDELLQRQILQRDGLHYVFEAQVWLAELRAELTAPEAQAICRRIAAVLERHDRDRLEVARYSWLAGDTRQLVDTLLAELAQGTRWDRSPRDYASMLTCAVDACAVLGRTRREWYVLLRELVKVGQDLSVPRMREHLRALFEQLELDTGLADARAAALDGSPARERLERTLQLAQARYDATPEHARCLAPLDAVTALTWLISETTAFAAQTADAHLFELLPSLEPFVPLALAVEHVERDVVPATRDLVAGRFEAARASHHRSLAFVNSDEVALFDDATRAWALGVLHYALGCIEAAIGRVQALEHAGVLEATPAWLVPAWTIRHIYYGAVGNVKEAERCRKHVELVLLQSPVKPPLVAGAAQQHVYTASLCDDVTGLRHAIAELTPIAAQQPVLAPFLEFARAEHARVCGDMAQALDLYAGLSGDMRAGEYPLWPRLIGCWITALLDLGRCDEALELGRRALADAERVQLGWMKHFVELPLGMVEVKCGEGERGRARVDAIVAEREVGGFEGASLGWAYEARARLAIWERDEASFEKYAMLCRQQYRKTGGNPALAAMYERLMQEARQAGAQVAGELAEALSRSTTSSSLHTTFARDRDLVRKLRVCRSAKERAQTALHLLLERARVRHGELYLLNDGGLTLAAATDVQADDSSFTLAKRLLEPVSDDGVDVGRACTAHDALHSAVVPLLLTYRSRGAAWLVGVAVLREEGERPAAVPLSAASVLAKALAELEDAKPRAVAGQTRTWS